MLYEQAPETRLEDRGYAEEVIEYESVIDTKDREAIKNAIAYARQTRSGLASMRGFSGFLQAREYHRAAKNALKLSKAVSCQRPTGQYSATEPVVAKLGDRSVTGFGTSVYDQVYRTRSALMTQRSHRPSRAHLPTSPLMQLLGDHEYIPASDNDSRSPCPALNALANHGILPRDGRNISAFQLMGALREHYHLSLLMAFVLSFLGTFICGRWFKVDLHDFARHNYMEHDASLTHRDAMPEGLYAPVDVDEDLLHDLLNASKGPDVLYFDDLLAVRVCRNRTLSRPLSGFSQCHNPIRGCVDHANTSGHGWQCAKTVHPRMVRRLTIT